MRTTDGTRLSTTREAGAYDVAAQNGDLAVIGDSSFLTPENARRVDNNVFIGNLADFLVTGEMDDVNLTTIDLTDNRAAGLSEGASQSTQSSAEASNESTDTPEQG